MSSVAPKPSAATGPAVSVAVPGGYFTTLPRGLHVTAVGTSCDRAGAAVCFSAFSQMGKLESNRSFTVGVTNDFSGIQAPLCRCPSPLFRRNTVTSTGRFSSSLTRGNPLLEKRSVSVVSPEQSLSGFYSRYFLIPKWGGKRNPPYSGPAGSEQVSVEIQIQNADTCSTAASSKTKRLVFVRGSERHVFPHSHLPPSQTISPIRLSGGVLRIPCSPIRPVSQPEGFHTVHRDRCRPAQTPVRTAGHVFGRLAPVGAVRTGGQGSHAHCHKTPYRFVFCNKYGEEPTFSDTGDILSGIIPAFRAIHCSSLGGERENFQSLPRDTGPSSSDCVFGCWV